MVINEWQLDVKLNQALHQAHRADFALYLSLLSPEVEEAAQFYTPEPVVEPKTDRLRQQLGIDTSVARRFALQDGDLDRLRQHSVALNRGGLSQLKLTSYLNPGPLTRFDEQKRIRGDVWQSLSLHARRHLTADTINKMPADPTALYEVLQQLHQHEAA
ncbi:MAG: hypothetical protein LPK11_08090 [Chromatiaceae bacterium]|nr:hypothetical protein [Chromatiaceae bacterium]